MQKVSIVMYHYIRDLQNSRYPGVKGLDLRLFREQVRFLNANYSIIRMEDLISACKGNMELPGNAALLTFDDGYIDHYTNAFPLLDELGIQGSFFFTCGALKHEKILDVNKIHLILASADPKKIFDTLLCSLDYYRGAEFDIPANDELIKIYAVPYVYDDGETGFIKRMLQTVLPKRLRALITDDIFNEYVAINVDAQAFANELYCNVEQAKTMKRHGMHIGVHGYSHEWLGNMDKVEYEEDVRRSVEEMGGLGLIDRTEWVMNYPYGSWNDGVVEYARNNGCALGLTTQKAAASPGYHDRMLLPRIDTNEFPPKSDRYMDIV